MSNDILLVGTGALATMFAARLGEAGHSVSMLGTWKQGLQALREKGARIVDADGNERAYKVHETNDPPRSNAPQTTWLMRQYQQEGYCY